MYGGSRTPHKPAISGSCGCTKSEAGGQKCMRYKSSQTLFIQQDGII